MRKYGSDETRKGINYVELYLEHSMFLMLRWVIQVQRINDAEIAGGSALSSGGQHTQGGGHSCTLSAAAAKHPGHHGG